MHPNAALLERFYSAFAARDHEAMARCYHPDAHFTDPVFDLRGPRVPLMWKMLCSRGKDLRVEHRGITADDERGSAHWDARYTFSQTGRSVHNVIDASFLFRDGVILRHEDRFDFHRWARQALGPAGLLLGGTRFLRESVAKKALAGLVQYEARHGAGTSR